MPIDVFESELYNTRSQDEINVLVKKQCNRCSRNCDRCCVDDMVKFFVDHVLPDLQKGVCLCFNS
mgnify:CR=1 FL=1